MLILLIIETLFFWCIVICCCYQIEKSGIQRSSTVGSPIGKKKHSYFSQYDDISKVLVGFSTSGERKPIDLHMYLISDFIFNPFIPIMAWIVIFCDILAI